MYNHIYIYTILINLISLSVDIIRRKTSFNFCKVGLSQERAEKIAAGLCHTAMANLRRLDRTSLHNTAPIKKWIKHEVCEEFAIYC